MHLDSCLCSFQQHFSALAHHHLSKDSPCLLQTAQNTSVQVRGSLFSRKKKGKSYAISYTMGEKETECKRHVLPFFIWPWKSSYSVFFHYDRLRQFPTTSTSLPI